MNKVTTRKSATDKPTDRPTDRLNAIHKKATGTAKASVSAKTAPKSGAIPAVKTPATRSTDGEIPAAAVILRKQDFLNRVVAATDVNKKEARQVIEATLRILGDALAAGETVVLPPLGKARVSRQVDRKMGEMLIVKLIRPSDGADKNSTKTEDEALAVASDCG